MSCLEYLNCDRICENHPYWYKSWNPIYSLTLNLHSSTVQVHQAYGYRWPSLFSQMAFSQPCQTVKVHYTQQNHMWNTSSDTVFVYWCRQTVLWSYVYNTVFHIRMVLLWQGLWSQWMALIRMCDVKLLPTTVLSYPVDLVSFCHLLNT